MTELRSGVGARQPKDAHQLSAWQLVLEFTVCVDNVCYHISKIKDLIMDYYNLNLKPR